MKKSLTGFGVLIGTFIISYLVNSQHSISLSQGFIPIGSILYLVGFFLVWLGIIGKLNMPKWAKWFLAALLSVGTIILIVYLRLSFGEI